MFPKTQTKVKNRRKRSSVKKGDVYEPIDYVWVFNVLRTRYQEPVGAPIMRIATQLHEIEGIIFLELGVGREIRKARGDVWGGLRRLGRCLNNREMPNYFKETIIAQSRKLRGVVGRHCATLDFMKKMKESDDGQFQDSFGKFLRTIGEYLNTDSIEKQFGKADVYDNAPIILTNSSRIPGSRAKGKDNTREEKGNRRKWNRREANVTNWEDQTWGTDNHQIQEGYEGDGEYREIFGGQSMDVPHTGQENEPQSIWIGKNW